ncbi:TolB-like protein [Litorimonas taeanensis]|uniref:TolB-like protein n=1 Tax=Litorimonas taeanensis TaxID=568099 RepID=A0A420WKM9_9PROT|nr:hypothetical protein [Litorimonas taeanensis]RKQ71568.1 TolB-like protein [Litorimonas taeanensis]
MGSVARAFQPEAQTFSDEVSEAVCAQLERVLRDDIFSETTRMKRFLRYVVYETLHGRSEQLKGYTIGVEVFDRPDDFDPQADTIVRVQAGQLRRRLDLYYADAGLEDPVRFIIPKGQYAPVFEMQRKGSESTNKSDTSMVVTQSQVSKTLKDELQTRPGIAVLAFQDLSEGAENHFFSEGLTTEIINALIQFRYLRIISCSPTIERRGQVADIKAVAKEYDVQFVLSGSIRRVGDVCRVWVDLLHAETGEHVFSRSIDKKFIPSQIFDLQEEIASYTAAKVAAPYGVVNRYSRRNSLAQLESMPAYDVVLRYYNMKNSPAISELLSLQERVDAVKEKHPKFSPILAIWSYLRTYQVTQTLSNLDAQLGLDEALEAAKKAVSLDPENSIGYMALYQAHFHKGNYAESERVARRSIALNPNDYSMLAYYSCTNAYQNYPERALAYHEASLQLIDGPPSWFYFCKIILAFRDNDFKLVLSLLPHDITLASPLGAQRFALSAMGHLGDAERPRAILAGFRKADADYDHKLVSTLNLWHAESTLHNAIIEGLKLAGVDTGT